MRIQVDAVKGIKIDKEIVWASFRDKAARIVLENEIHTIKQLGIPLIIEGIEEREQSEAMEQLGVECIQGYYYGKPVCVADFEEQHLKKLILG